MSPKEFLEGADRALAGLRARKRDPAVDALATYVEAIAANVRSKKLPPKPNRHAKSMGWILVDDWDPDDPLGKLILDLNDSYLKM
ncbi:MAG: hypothetical protein HYY17_15760 [Planctomycetes bacterium]|nr:hypothetical protein [Planctomycetota bacterium]